MDDNGVDNVLNRSELRDRRFWSIPLRSSTTWSISWNFRRSSPAPSGTRRSRCTGPRTTTDSCTPRTSGRARTISPLLRTMWKYGAKFPGWLRLRSSSSIPSRELRRAVRVNVPLTGLANGCTWKSREAHRGGGTGTLNAARIEVLDNTVAANNDPVRIEGTSSRVLQKLLCPSGPGREGFRDGLGRR